jgi:hypothetical protein
MRRPSSLSLLASGATHRLLAAILLVAGLWLAVAWALH